MISKKDYRFLVAHLLNQTKEEIFLNSHPTLTPEEEKILNYWVQRRQLSEPLSKIVGKRDFWKRTVYINEHTLDPRPESETLVEAVLEVFPDHSKSYKILDLGTGSGCLILSLLDEYPNAWGIGVDKSTQALGVALKNNNYKDRCLFVLGHWTQSLQGPFDIVVCNPPYISFNEVLPFEVRKYDPFVALYSGPTGLEAYQEIFSNLQYFSHLFLEVGHTQSKAVQAISPFECIGVKSDLSGIERVLHFKGDRIA